MARKSRKSIDERQASFFFEPDADELPKDISPKADELPKDISHEADELPDIDLVLPEREPAEKMPEQELQKLQESQELQQKASGKNKLRFMSFGSGSSGNCSYLGTDDGGLLIDAGVDDEFVFKSLLKNGVTPEMIGGVLLTHDHGDHIRHAYSIVRRYKHIRLYCTPRVMNGLLRRHSVSRRIKDYQERIFKEIPFKLSGFNITAFDTSHDGTDNMGFMIEWGDEKFVIATDMGMVNSRSAFYISQANYLVIESNYDRTMLDKGPYPEYLKQRIRRDDGHLDNEVAAQFVAQIYGPHLRYLFLCHLSHDNNTPQIALATMHKYLEQKGVTVGDCSYSVETRNCDLQLYALPRYDCSPLFVLTD
ncbi:MAG: MBL fold metallo-hydrolase [Muribaculaceae bacterium]